MSLEKYLKKKTFKIVLGGEGAVGKTTLARMLAGETNTDENIELTPGIEFHSLRIENEMSIDCQLWDLGGQTYFRQIQDSFFQSASIVILVFSVDRYNTFLSLDSWLEFIPQNIQTKIFLIANKIDCDKRYVKTDDALEFAKSFNLKYYELSALTGIGVNEFKQNLIETIVSLYNSDKK